MKKSGKVFFGWIPGVEGIKDSKAHSYILVSVWSTDYQRSLTVVFREWDFQ